MAQTELIAAAPATGQVAAWNYTSPFTFRHRLARCVWGVVWTVLFRPSPRPLRAWRRWLLRVFGAKIGPRALILPSAKIWAPWNLEMGEDSCLGPDVDCYCVEKISIGARATVSQYSYLCGASHDIADPGMRLISGPIVIGLDAWVCADAFIGMNVTVGAGAVVAARATVTRNVEPWTVVAGNPARFLKPRTLRGAADAARAE